MDSYDKILSLSEKYAQMVVETGPSLFDMFRKLQPPPSIANVPGLQPGDDFQIYASILPGPRIAFDVKPHGAGRTGRISAAITNIMRKERAPQMMKIIKSTLTPEEFIKAQKDGLPGEFQLWDLPFS